MAQKIQLRRGLEAQRKLVTPDLGEPLFTTDQKLLYIGDGVTAGGVAIAPAGSGGSSGTSGNYVLKNSGTQPIASGADYVAVTGLALPSVPGQVLVTVRKITGGLNLAATVRGDSISTTGFTVDLTAATDAATYKLDYLVIL